MKITKLARNVEFLSSTLPEIYSVGTSPILINGLVSDTSVVKDITFFETGAGSGKAYRGPCYVVSFIDSNLRHVIPATKDIHIEYEVDSASTDKKAAGKKKAKVAVVAGEALEDLDMTSEDVLEDGPVEVNMTSSHTIDTLADSTSNYEGIEIIKDANVFEKVEAGTEYE